MILLLFIIWLLLLVATFSQSARCGVANYTLRGYLHDPISGTAILTSLLISAATSAATYGLQRLLIKPKPIKQNRAGDHLLIQDSEWGLFIPEIYGARPADGKGGIKLAGNIIDASTIRAQTTTSTVESGGKGAPKQTVDKTSYYQDLDISFGRGRLRFLKLWAIGSAGAKVIYDITATGATGIIDATYDPPDPQDYFLLDDPRDPDPTPAGRYGFMPVPDFEGMIDAQIVGGGYANVRVYDGGEDQLPDPLFESIHGVGTVPAYRGLAHVVLENYDITDGHPTFLALVENMDCQTLDEIVEARALRAGLEATDVDFSALATKEVRGFLISQLQPPRTDMELLGRVYDADFYEGANGKVNGVLLDETIVVTLDEDYLGAGETNGGLSASVQFKGRDVADLPFRLDISCFDVDNNFETATRHATRQITSSQKHEPLDLPLALTTEELQRLANRELQERWRADGSYTFTTTHQYKHLMPTQKIKVPFKGTLKEMRIKEIQGSIPGIRTFTCIPASGVVLDSVGDAVAVSTSQTPAVPANTVLILIDVPRLYSPQDTPGFMWAAAPRDPLSGEWSRAALYMEKGSGTQFVDTTDGAATMGRVVISALSDVPVGWAEGEWDDDSTITADLFYGELETLTDAEVLDGGNVFVVGNEVVGVATWVRVEGEPNRWTGSRLQRRLKGTSSAGHLLNERIVLLNNAVRFVRVDESEKDIPRTYRAATLAPSASQSVADAAPVDFTWTGQTITDPQGSFAVIEGDTIIINNELNFDSDAARDLSRKNLGAADEISQWL